MSRPDAVEPTLERVVAQLRVGEARQGQLEMASAVMKAITDSEHVVVRAGTGTGKSLGYLVPAVLSKKRVVVATATKALQDQLATNDLPLVHRASGVKFSFEVLKGRANYLCRQRVRESEARTAQGALEGIDGADDATSLASGGYAADVRRILEWSARTTTGDRAELSVEPHPRVWSAFSVGADECPGAFHCPSGSDCFAEAARQRADLAEITVVNLHLLGADLANGGSVLPEYEVLVVDEAHELESVLSATLGTSISAARIRSVLAGARRASTRGQDALRSAIDALSEAAELLERLLSSREAVRLRSPLDEALDSLCNLISSRLVDLERALRDANDELDPATTRALGASGHLRESLGRLADLGDDNVAWIEPRPRPSIEIAPIDVSDVLERQLFPGRSVVFTSATVPLDLARRLGAPGEIRELDVGSPFDYEHHALLYCAAHLPDRRSPDAEARIFDELEVLINAAGGRTLALFTSWAAMRRAADALRDRLSYPVLCQGEQEKLALIEAFRDEHGACLFATMSFWQGVDVPGPTLSLVVIDRLPFPRPDDPLYAARREKVGRDAFTRIDLPRAANLLAQGAGRLIRGADDHGVVAVLDSRLANASYRWQLIRALPPMRRTKEREVVVEFLRSLAARSDESS